MKTKLAVATALVIMAATVSLGIMQNATAKGTPWQAGYDHGNLIIELPRALIDSPQVFVDGIHVPAKQTTINSKVRTLVVNFHKVSSKIEIQTTAAKSRPDIKGTSISENTPSVNNVNSLTKRIDYSILCTRLQPVLVQSCHTLVMNSILRVLS